MFFIGRRIEFAVDPISAVDAACCVKRAVSIHNDGDWCGHYAAVVMGSDWACMGIDCERRDVFWDASERGN